MRRDRQQTADMEWNGSSAFSWSRPLLRAKLTHPQIRPGLVQRPQLIARLNRGLQKRLTLVAAPPGYGKTTVILQWLSQLDRPSGWLSLDALDNDLSTFVAYTLAAAQAPYPLTGRLTAPLLASSQDVPPEAFADALIEDLAGLDGPLVLVFDDFHVIEDPQILRLMDRLLQFIPSNVHPVFTTRTDPPLTLARLRLRGELSEFRVDDLRFDPEETRCLLTDLTGVPFDLDSAATLDRRTEGWVLALQLAGLTMRPDETPAGRAGRFGRAVDEHVASFLMEEVFAHQPAHIRDFLMQTSILEHFSAPLCAAVSNDHQAAGILSRLLSSSQMIVPLDDGQQWFRYHHLFQQFLRDRLLETTPRQAVIDLHRRAAAWLGAQGQINEALTHAVAADDLEMAITLLEDNLYPLINNENWSQISRRLELLPAAAQNHPSILLARGWLHVFHLRIPALIHTLDEAEQQLASAELSPARRDSLQTQINVLRGITFYWLFDGEKTMSLLEQNLPRLSPEMVCARGIASNYIGLSMHIDGHSLEALQYLQSVIDNQVNPNDFLTVRVLTGIMMISADIGQMQAGLHAAAMLADIGLRNKFWNSYGWGYYGLGFIHYKMNQLQQAEEDLRHVLESPLQYNASCVIHAYLLMALTLQARGRDDEADEVIRRGREFTISTSNLAILPSFAAAEQQLSLDRGRPVSLSPTPIPSLLDAITDMQLPRPISTILTRARCLIRMNSPESLQKAQACLAVLHEAAERMHAPRQLAGIMAIEAIALAAQGDEAGAQATLRRSMSLVEADQPTRIYIDCGPGLLPLLRQLAQSDDAPAMTAQVLSAAEDQWQAARQKSQSATALDPATVRSLLTNREYDVLCLMAEQLSDKQIAARLYVSPGAIRQYASHLYAKMNVSNRREAVSKAVEYGLI